MTTADKAWFHLQLDFFSNLRFDVVNFLSVFRFCQNFWTLSLLICLRWVNVAQQLQDGEWRHFRSEFETDQSSRRLATLEMVMMIGGDGGTWWCSRRWFSWEWWWGRWWRWWLRWGRWEQLCWKIRESPPQGVMGDDGAGCPSGFGQLRQPSLYHPSSLQPFPLSLIWSTFSDNLLLYHLSSTYYHILFVFVLENFLLNHPYSSPFILYVFVLVNLINYLLFSS